MWSAAVLDSRYLPVKVLVSINGLPSHRCFTLFAWPPSLPTSNRLIRGHYFTPTMLSSQVGPMRNFSTNTALERRLDGDGLPLNMKRMEDMECGQQPDGTIAIDDVDLEKVAKFKYLGSIISCDGNLAEDIRKHINAAWAKWHQVSGALYDRWISTHLTAET